jgi:hypothetical protein
MDRKLQRIIFDLEDLTEERINSDAVEEIKEVISKLKGVHIYSTEN